MEFYLGCFFCFKQKTAYEMRISDWSSDVCSSDLFTLLLPVEARPVIHRLTEKGILGGVSLGRLYPDNAELANGLVVAVTETVTEADIAAFAAALKEVLA